MKTVSMLQFRRQTAKVLAWLQSGKDIIRLTYRGKPIADLVPVKDRKAPRPRPTDPFYRMFENAVEGRGLTNEEIDQIIYGQA